MVARSDRRAQSWASVEAVDQAQGDLYVAHNRLVLSLSPHHEEQRTQIKEY